MFGVVGRGVVELVVARVAVVVVQCCCSQRFGSVNKQKNQQSSCCLLEWRSTKSGNLGKKELYFFINTRVTATTTENKNNGFACFRRNGVFRLLLVLSVVPVE